MNERERDILIDKLASGELSDDERTCIEGEGFEYIQVSDAIFDLLHSPEFSDNRPPERIYHVLRSKKHRVTIRLGAMLAVAAALVLMIIFSFRTTSITPTRFPRGVPVASKTVAANRPVTVSVIYNTPRTIENAEVVISLGKNVSFISNNKEIAKKRSIRWKGKLLQGKTPIPFAVMPPQTGTSVITTKVYYDGIVHTHLIVLRAKDTIVSIVDFRLRDVPSNDS